VGIGEAMALGSAATWAVGVILARQLGVHLPPLALNLLKNGLVLAVLAPVALVLLTETFQSIFVLVMAILIARFIPKLATESIDRTHVALKGVAICITGLGTYLLLVAR